MAKSAVKAADLLSGLRARRNQMVASLRELVEIESPSLDKTAVDRLGAHLATKFEKLGGRVTIHRAADYGHHVQADFPGESGRPVLLLGHFDTVWDLGTLATMPFRVAEGRAWGPGSFDMKAGIVQGMFAVEALRSLRGTLPRPVTFLLVTDEEVGSISSRPLTEGLAKQSAAALVLEPSFGPRGALKTARKGGGSFVIKVTGREAHAGLDFQKGESAILELARLIGRIEKFTELDRGITVNPGIIRGGTRANVVAGEAVAEVDARIVKSKDIAHVEKKFRSLKPVNRKCRLEVTNWVCRPPLERTKLVAGLFELACGIAAELGWKLEEAAVGGGSDGNYTSALGVPTLDGLGAVGDGAHARNESVVIAEMPRRAALVAALLAAVP